MLEIGGIMSTDQYPSRRTKSSHSESETVANLRSLIQSLESNSIPENHNPRDHKQRFLKMREEISRIARKEARLFCNCEQITVAESWRWEEFAAKMNTSCPIHGPCRLGVVVSFMGDPRDDDDRRLVELLRDYDRRCLTTEIRRLSNDEP